MILPAMGAITEILPTSAKRTIFGYKAIAFSSLAIAASAASCGLTTCSRAA